MFRDPVIKIFTDILFSWETIVVVLGLLAIFIFFAISKKKYQKSSSTSTTNTKIYSDLYSLNEMYKKELITEEEYKKGKEFISKTVKESIKKEKESLQSEKTLITETSKSNIEEGKIPEQPKQQDISSLPISEEITIPPTIQKFIDDGLITQTEYINKLKSL